MKRLNDAERIWSGRKFLYSTVDVGNEGIAKWVTARKPLAWARREDLEGLINACSAELMRRDDRDSPPWADTDPLF